MTKEKASDSIHASQFKPRIGLALGSGMARGFAHIGVIRQLLHHGIRPTIVAGTSIGSLVGACYLTGKMDVFEEWARSLNRRKVFGYLDFRIRSAGLIGGKKLEKLMEDHFGEMLIEDLPNPFTAIAADLGTGHEVWLAKGNLINSLRASFALPGVFPPVDHDHRLLVDGALVNPVPVSTCQAMGARMTIAVDLNADLIGKVTKPGEKYQTVTGFDVFNNEHVAPEDQKMFEGGFTQRLFHREVNHPSLFGVMISALNILQDRLTRSRLAGDPPDVHIKPHIGHFGLLEFERAEEMIEEGRLAVDRALPEIRAAMDALLGLEILPKNAPQELPDK
jgi:NTE family protein